jgi:hypothetical protein
VAQSSIAYEFQQNPGSCTSRIITKLITWLSPSHLQELPIW